MAKLLMATSMWLVGDSPFGWRLSGALLGLGSVIFVYLIGVTLLRNRTVGLLAAALFALDGLPLTLSRIGTNDSVFLFFTLGTLLFFLKDKYFVSAVFLGFATSSKLSFILIPPVLFVLFFLLKKKLTMRLAWFVIVPSIIFLLSFVPFFTIGHTFSEFVQQQQQTNSAIPE